MSERQTVSVVGHGDAQIQPDVVIVSLGVEVVAASPAAALQGCSEALSGVRTALLDTGVAAPRMQTSQISVQPLWREDRYRSVPAEYSARAGLAVSVDDPAGLGRLLAAATAAGGDAARVHSIRWACSDPAAAEATARDAAFNDARRRAEQYATLAGRSIGSVVRITEGDDGFRSRRFGNELFAGASAAMDVDAGEVAVTAAVTVTWELD